MRILENLRDRFFGRGAYSITVPPMDGVLRPNERLEAAPVLAQCPAPNHLQAQDGALWLASGASIVRVENGSSTVEASFPAPITAFARTAHGRQGVATLDGALHLPEPVRSQEMPRQCMTGIAFDSAGGCFLTVGSSHNPANAWQKDLLERRASGSLWYVSAAGDARRLAGDLAWPQSPLAQADGSVLLSECSGSRVLRVTASGQREVVLQNLPGYPAGIARTHQGYALCIQAPRSQLMEFILREPEFCAQMIREIAPRFWIAPALAAAQSFQEPLQGGALKQLGIMKPWAPSRSYGLVIELDPHFLPLRSHHSRANGTRHGTVSCAVLDNQLAVASVGAGCVLTLPLDERALP